MDLGACGPLAQVRALGTTGSPLSEEAQRWGTEQFERLGVRDIWWCNMSGGTDFAGAFIWRQPRTAAGAGRNVMPAARLRGRGVERAG